MHDSRDVRNLYARDRVAQAVVDFRRMHDWQAPHLRLLDWYKKVSSAFRVKN